MTYFPVQSRYLSYARNAQLVYVDSVNGSDVAVDGLGSLLQPFQTIEAALAHCVAAPAGNYVLELAPGSYGAGPIAWPVALNKNISVHGASRTNTDIAVAIAYTSLGLSDETVIFDNVTMNAQMVFDFTLATVVSVTLSDGKFPVKRIDTLPPGPQTLRIFDSGTDDFDISGNCLMYNCQFTGGGVNVVQPAGLLVMSGCLFAGMPATIDGTLTMVGTIAQGSTLTGAGTVSSDASSLFGLTVTGPTASLLDDATKISFSPTVPANWSPVPSTEQAALDQLATRSPAAVFTQGSVWYQGATGVTEDNANFFWDDATKNLKLDGQKFQTNFTDPFARPALWAYLANQVALLGSWQSDGLPTNVNSEGVVVYGDEALTGVPIAAGDGSYARIKANRLGLFSVSSTLPFYAGGQYWYRVDPTQIIYRDNAGNSAFSVQRTTGNTVINGTTQIKSLTDGYVKSDAFGNLSVDASTLAGPVIFDQTKVVSKNGNDGTADGSWQKPYLTVQAAMASIADASPTKRYNIFVFPGRYTETNLQLKANVFITGYSFYNTRIQNNVAIIPDAATFTPDADNRIGFVNINIASALDINFNTASSNQGKFYATGCQITAGLTMTALTGGSNINQSIIDDCQIFGGVTQYGWQGVYMNTIVQSGNIVVNPRVDGLGNSSIDMQTTTVHGNVTIGTGTADTISATLRGEACDGTVTFNGSGVSASVTNQFLTSSPTVLNGAVVTLLSRAQNEGYSPAVPGNWAPAPTEVASALDQLAARPNLTWQRDSFAAVAAGFVTLTQTPNIASVRLIIAGMTNLFYTTDYTVAGTTLTFSAGVAAILAASPADVEVQYQY